MQRMTTAGQTRDNQRGIRMRLKDKVAIITGAASGMWHA